MNLHQPTSGLVREPGNAGKPTGLISIELDTHSLSRLLIIIAAVLIVIGTLANLLIHQVVESPDSGMARVMRRFDLGHEPSLPAWFSSIVLLLNSAMLILIGWAGHLLKQKFSAYWIALGIIFLGLSIDEVVMFHEMLDKLVRMAVPSDGGLQLPWVIVGFTFVLCVFLAYLRFLFNLPRRFAFLFILSGAVFVGGAVGMETVSGYFIGLHGVSSVHHTFAQTIEESMEMAGAILFFHSLGEYWKHAYGRLTIGSGGPERFLDAK